MRKITLLLLLSLFSLVGKATFYVVPGGSGLVNGSSWSNAYADIQAAINAASTLYGTSLTQQEVWVKTGTYSTSSAAIIMKLGVDVHGGFAGSESDKTLRSKGTNAWDYTNVTTLNGGATKRCVEAGGSNYTSVIILDGFTLTNGNGTGVQLTGNGGGALLRANMKLQNCIVTGNTTIGNGGGVNAVAGIISNCWIYNNTTTSGTIPAAGGIYSAPVAGFNTIIENSLIERNSQGGVRFQSTGLITMDRCIIRNNTSTGAGAAIFTNNPASCTITNCLITNNSGVSNVYLNKGKLINSTVANNEGGVYLASATNIAEVYNNIIVNNNSIGTSTGNSVSVVTSYPAGYVKNNAVYPAIDGQTWGGATNTLLITDMATANSDVAFKTPTTFVGASSVTTNLNEIAAANWTVKAGSKVVNFGDNTLIPSGITTDYAGNTRTLYTTVDAGAYEYVKTTPTLTWSQDLTKLTSNDLPLTLTASLVEGNNGSSITYTSDNEAVVTVSGNTLNVVGIGTAVITAHQAANTYFNAASDVTQNVTVVDGNITIDGNHNATEYTLSTQTDITVNTGGHLTVNAPTTVKSITVNAGGKMTNSSTLNLTTLTINSDATHGTGTFVDNGTATITTSNVQQYITSGRNWYMSSPVSNASVATINTATGTSLVGYDEIHGSTLPWVTEVHDTLTAGKGYIVVAPTNLNPTLIFSGSLNTGDQSFTLSRTPGQTKEGFNLVGNPYPSYVNLDSVVRLNVKMDKTIWYRTRNFGNTAYEFDTYNTTSKIGTNNNGYGDVTGIIPPMQSVWVRVSPGQTSSALNFNNGLRSHRSVALNPLRSEAVQTVQPVLRLRVSNGTNSDEAIVYLNAKASSGYDVYDSPKMTNGDVAVPEIYTLAEAEKVTINGLNDVSQNEEIVLGFTTGQSNQFSLRATQFANFDDQTTILLKDKLLNKVVDLTDGLSYSFSSEAASTENRFALLFKSADETTGLNVEDRILNSWIIGNTSNQITVQCMGHFSKEATVSVYNSLGQLMLDSPITNSNTVLAKSFTSGVYFVKINNGGINTYGKVVVR